MAIPRIPQAPKALSSPSERVARSALLSQPHMAGLVGLVEGMRQAKGPEYRIPAFDPLDGGTCAEVLFLLEAPGPRAIDSGFVSRDNPDETARNFFLLNEEAGVDRRRTIIWNAVPWYIGSGTKIRPAIREDVRQADEWLRALLRLLPRLRVVAFLGRKALHARDVVQEHLPGIVVVAMPHPSPMFINRAIGNRGRVFTALQEVATRMATASDR